MKILNCRNCKSPKIERVFSLGNIFYTGKFPKKDQLLKRGPINVAICKKCTLVQLENNFDLNYLYGPDYGYRTGINKTMTNHVKNVVRSARKITKIQKNDLVLDIASNDGTLLNFYDKKIITFGIDPIIKKYKKNYKNINYKISDFFSASKLKKITKRKFKIITALSVFYDLKDPNKFLKDIESILDDKGVLIIELADLGSIIEKNVFDTFCHEHLEYYSSKVINEMCKKNSLRLFNINQNDINGGSLQFYICKSKANFKNNKSLLKKFFNREKLLKLNKKETFIKFIDRVDKIKLKIRKFLDEALKKIKQSMVMAHLQKEMFCYSILI